MALPFVHLLSTPEQELGWLPLGLGKMRLLNFHAVYLNKQDKMKSLHLIFMITCLMISRVCTLPIFTYVCPQYWEEIFPINLR